VRIHSIAQNVSQNIRWLGIPPNVSQTVASWLREAGVPDGALKANEPAPDLLLPEANGSGGKWHAKSVANILERA
jgi:hypothetical protein